MKRKTLWITLAVIILIALAGSGWVYNAVRSNNLTRNNEMAVLQTTFVQQYGGQATIKQLVSPDKVYAAVWIGEDGITHVSWNIGGLWVTVWSSPAPTTPAP